MANAVPTTNPYAPLYPWPRTMRAPSRREAEDMVEGLLAYLDRMDGDGDLEHEEPESSAMEWAGSGAHRFNVGLAA